MTWIRNNIANLLTCLNLCCGFVAISFLVSGESRYEAVSIASYLILLAGLFDFFDGFVARLVKSASNIGKDLDSLADMVTFGVLPGILLFSVMQSQQKLGLLPNWVVYSSALVPVFSAIRLAVFNNDARQSDQFIGMPTPANTLFITFFLRSVFTPGDSLTIDPWFLPGISLFCAIMLIAPIPLIAIKFKDFSFEKNKARFGLILIAVLLFVWQQFNAIPLIIISYLALSILNNWFSKK